MKFSELITYVIIGLLLIWFLKSSAILQISLGVLILILLLWRDSSEGKVKNNIWERASHETFYDTMKWLVFGIFVVIYPAFLKTNLIAFLITVFIFIMVLYGLNVLKERNSSKK